LLLLKDTIAPGCCTRSQWGCGNAAGMEGSS